MTVASRLGVILDIRNFLLQPYDSFVNVASVYGGLSVIPLAGDGYVLKRAVEINKTSKKLRKGFFQFQIDRFGFGDVFKIKVRSQKWFYLKQKKTDQDTNDINYNKYLQNDLFNPFVFIKNAVYEDEDKASEIGEDRELTKDMRRTALLTLLIQDSASFYAAHLADRVTDRILDLWLCKKLPSPTVNGINQRFSAFFVDNIWNRELAKLFQTRIHISYGIWLSKVAFTEFCVSQLAQPYINYQR